MRLFRVSGRSMSPTLQNGDLVLCFPVKRPESIHTGDIIVFRTGRNGQRGAYSIKRVAATAGERFPPIHPETLVPQSFVAVLGDNALVSADSRKIGFVPAEAVIGKVRLSLSKSGLGQPKKL